MKPAPAILRDVAALVLRRGLDGRTFPAAVDSTAGAFGRDAPQVVREAAAFVRFGMPGATAAEVARLLVDRAEGLETEASSAGGSTGVAPKVSRPENAEGTSGS